MYAKLGSGKRVDKGGYAGCCQTHEDCLQCGYTFEDSGRNVKVFSTHKHNCKISNLIQKWKDLIKKYPNEKDAPPRSYSQIRLHTAGTLKMKKKNGKFSSLPTTTQLKLFRPILSGMEFYGYELGDEFWADPLAAVKKNPGGWRAMSIRRSEPRPFHE